MPFYLNHTLTWRVLLKENNLADGEMQSSFVFTRERTSPSLRRGLLHRGGGNKQSMSSRENVFLLTEAMYSHRKISLKEQKEGHLPLLNTLLGLLFRWSRKKPKATKMIWPFYLYKVSYKRLILLPQKHEKLHNLTHEHTRQPEPS